MEKVEKYVADVMVICGGLIATAIGCWATVGMIMAIGSHSRWLLSFSVFFACFMYAYLAFAAAGFFFLLVVTGDAHERSFGIVPPKIPPAAIKKK